MKKATMFGMLVGLMGGIAGMMMENRLLAQGLFVAVVLAGLPVMAVGLWSTERRRVAKIIRPAVGKGMIEAWKVYREKTGCSLEDAKEVVTEKIYRRCLRKYVRQRVKARRDLPPSDRIQAEMVDYLSAAVRAVSNAGMSAVDYVDVARLAAQWKWADTLAARGKRPPEVF